MLSAVRKRPADGSELSSAVPPGGAIPLPQLSTSRLKEALAAGGVGGLVPKLNLAGMPQVPCKYHLRGGCAKGKLCPFSHDGAALSVPLDQKLRTPCKYYELGQCVRGGACKFAHGGQEISQIQQMLRDQSRKKARVDESPNGKKEDEPLDPLSLGLSVAKGFQDFNQFDASLAGPTDLEARVTPSKDDPLENMFEEFLAEVDGGSTSSGRRPPRPRIVPPPPPAGRSHAPAARHDPRQASLPSRSWLSPAAAAALAAESMEGEAPAGSEGAEWSEEAWDAESWEGWPGWAGAAGNAWPPTAGAGGGAAASWNGGTNGCGKGGGKLPSTAAGGAAPAGPDSWAPEGAWSPQTWTGAEAWSATSAESWGPGACTGAVWAAGCGQG